MRYGEAADAGVADGRWLATYVERSSVTFARVAGLLGLVNAVVSAVIAGMGGSSLTKTALLACYVPAWAAVVILSPQLRSAAARWSLTLPLLGGLGVLPTFWDGGAPSAFSGVTWWICWVAATVATPAATLATVFVVAGLPAIAAYTTTSGSLAAVDGTAVLGSTIIPFFIGAIGLMVGGTFRWILDGATGRLAVAGAGGGASTAGLGRLLGGQPMVMPIGFLGASSWPLPVDVSRNRLTPAQREVVDLLATGLAAKQIAVARGTSIETVRTQIKKAKRAVGARTISELVARTCPQTS